MAHNSWSAVKRPDAQNWIIQDEMGFAMLTMDRDGWRAKNIAKLLNAGEEALAPTSWRNKEITPQPVSG